MRNLLMASLALVVMLGIVSANLWRELRSDRQLIADLQDNLAQAKASAAEPAQAQALQPTIEAETASAVAAPPPEPQSVPPAAQLAPAPAPAPAPSVVLASVRRIPTTASEEARRADAFMQSDQTATARVLAWSNQLTLAGQTLTTEQLQALNAAATAELRRETEESLEIDSRAGPMNAEAVARLKEETINRQHDTNLRILAEVAPQLTAGQGNALRELFEAWVTPRLAVARAERERAAASGN